MSAQTFLRTIVGAGQSNNERIRRLCVPSVAQHSGEVLTVGDLVYHSIVDPDERSVRALLRHPGIAFGELVIEERHGRWVDCTLRRRTIGLDTLAVFLEAALVQTGCAGCHVAQNDEWHRLEVHTTEEVGKRLDAASASGEDRDGPFTNRWIPLTVQVTDGEYRFVAYCRSGMRAAVALVRDHLDGFVDLSPRALEESAFPVSLTVRSHTCWRDSQSGKTYVETVYNPHLETRLWEHESMLRYEGEEGEWAVLVLGGAKRPAVTLNGQRLQPDPVLAPSAHMLAAQKQFREWEDVRCSVEGCHRPAAFTLLAPCGEGDGMRIAFGVYVCDDPEHTAQREREIGSACPREPYVPERW